ncbi:hypothetical protein [Synechocystis sp. LKSZ1]|uniref:hypothetical protein n=1 Tax=Synechocystis sp. LKSZ1 TaxID=3144951 RepID=UPI00336BC325
MKKLLLGCLALTTLTTLALPAHAGDEANVQDATQVITQDGDGNTSFQRSTQKIQSQHRGMTSTDNLGNAQSIYQDALQQGSNNYGQQENNQQIKVRRNLRNGSTEMMIRQGN